MTRRSALEVTKEFLASFEREHFFDSGIDYENWLSLLAEDVVAYFPFSPPGMPARCEGRSNWSKSMEGLLSAMKHFTWTGLNIVETEHAEIVYATGRSQVVTVSGRPYGNQYSFVFRVRAGLLVEYYEFFNPDPIVRAFGPLS